MTVRLASGAVVTSIEDLSMTAFAADDPVYVMNDTAYREIPSPGGGTTVRSRLWNAGEHRPLSAIRAAFGAGDSAYSGDEGSEGGDGDPVGGGGGGGPVTVSGSPIARVGGSSDLLTVSASPQPLLLKTSVFIESGDDVYGDPGTGSPLAMTVDSDGYVHYPETAGDAVYDIFTDIRINGFDAADYGKPVRLYLAGDTPEMFSAQWSFIDGTGQVIFSVCWFDQLFGPDAGTGQGPYAQATIELVTVAPTGHPQIRHRIMQRVS